MEPEEQEVEQAAGASSPTQKVGDLGRFRLIAELARGGMGIVYLSLFRGPGGFNKLFVVKELKSHLADDPNLVRMFLEEARLAAKLSHPNVVQTIEVGSDGDRHYIAMEFLDGQALNRVVARSRRNGTTFPLHFQLHVIVHLLEGLEYAHSATDFDGTPLNLVHRDVSPHNVFVTYDGQVKVVDFGIAKAMGSTNDTGTGVLKGKVAYMAPEQAAGERIDRRTDLFAAGVMLWEAVVGQRMWSKMQNDLQILHGLMHGAIPRPSDVKPDVDRELERIIMKATSVEPDHRYATAADFQRDLETFLKKADVASFGSRDVGRFVSDLFAVERANIKQVIDDQLRLLRGVGSGDYATIDLPRLMSTGPQSGTPSGLVASGASRRSGPVSSSGSGASGAYRSALAAPPLPIVESPPPARRSSPGVLVALVGTAMLVAGGGTLLVMRRSGASTEPHAPPPVVASTTSAPAPSIAPASEPAAVVAPVTVKVRAAPATARITIDDGPAQQGAFIATYPRDGKVHAIQIQAPQYQPRQVTFVADDDHDFDVALAPASPGAPVVVWRTAPTPPQPSSGQTAAPVGPAADPKPATAPTTTGRKKQQIDQNDPYANQNGN